MSAASSGTDLVGDLSALLGRSGSVILGKRGADPGRDDAALGLARVGEGVPYDQS